MAHALPFFPQHLLDVLPDDVWGPFLSLEDEPTSDGPWLLAEERRDNLVAPRARSHERGGEVAGEGRLADEPEGGMAGEGRLADDREGGAGRSAERGRDHPGAGAA